MAWCSPGAMPLSEPRMVSLPMHICVIQPQWDKHGPLSELASEFTALSIPFIHVQIPIIMTFVCVGYKTLSDKMVAICKKTLGQKMLETLYLIYCYCPCEYITIMKHYWELIDRKMVAMNFKRTVLRLEMHEIFKSLWLLNLNLSQWTQEVIVDSIAKGHMYNSKCVRNSTGTINIYNFF